jgi:hypothetical protein
MVARRLRQGAKGLLFMKKNSKKTLIFMRLGIWGRAVFFIVQGRFCTFYVRFAGERPRILPKKGQRRNLIN